MIENQILNIVLAIGALLVLGLICSFFVILSAHKESIWEEIYDRYIRGEKDDR